MIVDGKIKISNIIFAGNGILSSDANKSFKISAGFDKVIYVGAFAESENWLEGCTEFDPNNKKY